MRKHGELLPAGIKNSGVTSHVFTAIWTLWLLLCCKSLEGRFSFSMGARLLCKTYYPIKNTLISPDVALADITMNMFILSKSNAHRSAAENTHYHTKGPQEENKCRVGLLGTFTVSATQSAPRNCFSRKYVVAWCRAAWMWTQHHQSAARGVSLFLLLIW